MTIYSFTRQATPDEMGREIDRRGECICKLETEILRLRTALSTARENALREAEQKCRMVALNAECRAASYAHEEDKVAAAQAIASAMDKREAALLCADTILSLINKPQEQKS